MSNQQLSKETRAVHSSNGSPLGGVVSAVEPSSAFRYIDEGPQPYPRYFNTPNQEIVINQLCQLENAQSGLVFSSGMAAISTMLRGLLARGEHVVLQEALYGGTQAFVLKEFETLGIDYTLAKCDSASLAAAVQPNTRVVYTETPANPLMEIVDLVDLASRISDLPVISVVDNTFASPVNQNPIELGIDMVVHSGTKYLGGHNDLSFGAVLGSTKQLEKVYEKAILYGGNLNSFSLYLIERSMKTLFVRVEKQNQNAMEIANFLSNHEFVEAVFYPGLEGSPGHDIASAQMRGFGGMLAFRLAANLSGKDFLQKLKLITPAMSLGGVDTTVTMPTFTSHKAVPREVREAAGITEQLVRMSVGIESVCDLIADLEQALTPQVCASLASR
ncbi:MAG: PLP-dependent aspartate aminotransferase family protein [Pirellulaceae bacterium]